MCDEKMTLVILWPSFLYSCALVTLHSCILVPLWPSMWAKIHSSVHCPTPYQLWCRSVLPVHPTPYITRCLFIVKIQGNKMGGNTPNGFSGSGKCSAIVASLPFDPKIVSLVLRLQDKYRTSKSYSRWCPSNKHLHADQFSSATLRLKFYWSNSTSTVGKKTLDEVLTVVLGRKRLTTISIAHWCLTW